MHAADRRSNPRRFAAPAVAIAAAATVAVAPMSASAAITAPSLPPIVGDLGGAASAVANWATATGLKIVTDPITGLTKLVTDQVGNATVIGGVLGTGSQAFVDGISTLLPAAVEAAQAKIAAGEYGAAWEEITAALTLPVIDALLGGMLPLMGHLGPQLGPINDAFQAALPSIVGLVLAPIGTVTSVPKVALDGIGVAAKALQAGDPGAAIEALLAGAGAVGQTVIDGVADEEFGFLPAAIKFLPSILSGLAGSSWAGAGPFSTAAGTPVSFAAASSSTLAASPTALPALPDFGQLPGIWQSGLAQVWESIAGPYGWESTFTSALDGLGKGLLASPYQQVAGALIAPLLNLGSPILGTTQLVNAHLGPLGAGLDGAGNALIFLAMGASFAVSSTPAAALTGIENVVKALAAGDVAGALNATISGTGTTLHAAVDALFSDNPYSIGLVPGIVNVGTGFLEGVTATTPPAVGLAESADTPGPVAGRSTVSTPESLAGEPVETEVQTPQTEVPAETPAEPKPETSSEPKPETPAEPKSDTKSETSDAKSDTSDTKSDSSDTAAAA